MSEAIIFHGDGVLKEWDNMPSYGEYGDYRDSLDEPTRDACFVYLKGNDFFNWYSIHLEPMKEEKVPQKYRMLAHLIGG